MATPFHCIFLFFFFLLLLSLSAYEAAKIHRSIRAGSLPLQSNKACSTQGFNGSGLILHHRYGPCSGLKGQKPTQLELLSQDQQRVSWIQGQVRKSLSQVQPEEETTIPARSGAPLGTQNYVVTIGFGTPKRDMTVVFDTGSDLTWIQCKPCTVDGCYQQEEPIFDPAQSSSYANIPCNSAECSQLRSGRCSSSTCQYFVQYGDKSTTIGSYARDTLTLTPTDVFPSFRFGCGHDNEGLFNGSAGLLGLGRGTESFVTQSVEKHNGIFSYCLPASEKSTGYLTFGAENVPGSVSYTPMRTNPNIPMLYSVDVTGISVNGQMLSVPPSTFGAAGTIIDSGTVISRLPGAAYDSLVSAVMEAMPGQATSYAGFEVCYEMGENVAVPKITLHMEGVDLELPRDGVLVMVNERLGCLAFRSMDDDIRIAIIGNVQQRTFGVVYDVPNRRIGFAADGCS